MLRLTEAGLEPAPPYATPYRSPRQFGNKRVFETPASANSAIRRAQSLVRLRGIEPPPLSRYAPQAYVYAISPQPHISAFAENRQVPDWYTSSSSKIGQVPHHRGFSDG